MPPADGAEGMITGKVLAGDPNSVDSDRTLEEILSHGWQWEYC